MSQIENTVNKILPNRHFGSELIEQQFEGSEKSNNLSTSPLLKVAIMFPAFVIFGAIFVEHMLVWVKG